MANQLSVENKMRIFVIICLILIAISLLTAGISLIKDQGKGTRTVRSLTMRIGLSVLLFIAILVATYMHR